MMFTACSWGESASGGGDDTPPPDAAPAVCGDGVCAATEVGKCAADCGGQTNPVCGNGTCETGESTASCPGDCPASGPVCGNGSCENGEDATTCPGDCGGGGGNCPADITECIPCLLDPSACPPGLDQAACQACILGGGGGGGGAGCVGGLPNGVCDPGEDMTTCPFDCM
ncbi:MAG TPA: hypothetical protein VFQ53_42855 [Kofleriaceae bacterium]|nr:hypothetical protein [Kofleriaceae bacterium]